MIALLFTLIVVHFSITLVLLIRYTALKRELATGSVKREIYSVMREFNAQAERNIQILEDRIQEFQQLSLEAKRTISEKKLSSSRGSHLQESHLQGSHSGESHKGASLLSFLKAEKLKAEKLKETGKMKEAKEQKRAKNLEKQSKEKSSDAMNIGSKRTVSSLEKPRRESFYYIQEMYNQGQPKTVQAKSQVNRQGKKSANFKTNSKDDASILQDKEQASFSSSRSSKGFSTSKDFSAKELPSKTKNQIARLIGEGKSYEEIAKILGLSLSEIRLFVSILRKKILDSASVS